MPLPGIRVDPVTIQRSATTVDSDGNTVGAITTVSSPHAFLGMPSLSDVQMAAQRGQTINVVMAIETGIDIQDGDRVTGRGKTYDVVGVEDVRFHQRVMLREVS